MRISTFFRPNVLFALAIVLAFALEHFKVPGVTSLAFVLSEIFIKLLKLVSLPIIFLSLVSTATGMQDYKQLKFLSLRIVRYTLLTTVLAAAIALCFYLILDPVTGSEELSLAEAVAMDRTSYFDYFLKTIPSNMLRPFVENQVISVMMIAILISLSIVSLPKEHKAPLHALFHSFYLIIMKITGWIVKLMPLAVFAFLVLFLRDIKAGMDWKSIARYLIVVVSANLTQGIVILPLLLKLKGIAPLQLAKQMMPALYVAFFSKSSSATIPMAIKCATERAHISSGIANFSLPLCVTINMNGCAAFILTTVLFISMSNGIEWSYVEMAGWVIIATVAAFGNAGVPMGCYFLSSAILAAMNVPLSILGIILPFYTIIDMVETALNVWSDSCVTAIVAKEAKESVLTQEIQET